MQSVNIIVGSQMGSAEYVAEQLAEALEQQGIQVQLHEQPVFDDIDQQDTIWLLCTSTYGAGDYPENLLPFVESINQQADLKGLNYSVIGPKAGVKRFSNEISKGIQFRISSKIS